MIGTAHTTICLKLAIAIDAVRTVSAWMRVPVWGAKYVKILNFSYAASTLFTLPKLSSPYSTFSIYSIFFTLFNFFSPYLTFSSFSTFSTYSTLIHQRCDLVHVRHMYRSNDNKGDELISVWKKWKSWACKKVEHGEKS